jgi:hypothetical protein
VLLSKRPDGRFVSFFGDLHPSYFGNVVKAMGGAKQGYPVVSRVLEKVRPAVSGTDADFVAALNDQLRATVHEVIRLTPTIVEVVVRAPLAAKKFQPGQFYRLQNFETLAQHVDGTRLAMEGLALTGAWVNRDKGLVSTIVLEMGGSSDLCALLKPGEPVILMGPTGSPTEIRPDETVVLAGGGLGNAVLFSIGKALRAAGSKVLYFAGYASDRPLRLRTSAAHVGVVLRRGAIRTEPPGRSCLRGQRGAGVAARTGQPASGDRLLAADRIMRSARSDDGGSGAARHGALARTWIRITSRSARSGPPMQCMMKEICAQCLQPHVDQPVRVLRVLLLQPDQPLDRSISLRGWSELGAEYRPLDRPLPDAHRPPPFQSRLSPRRRKRTQRKAKGWAGM